MWNMITMALIGGRIFWQPCSLRLKCELEIDSFVTEFEISFSVLEKERQNVIVECTLFIGIEEDCRWVELEVVSWYSKCLDCVPGL